MTRARADWFGRLPHPRYLLFLSVLILAPWPLGAVMGTGNAIFASFDIAALCFVLSCVPLWLGGTPEVIRRQAQRDDVGQVVNGRFPVFLDRIDCRDQQRVARGEGGNRAAQKRYRPEVSPEQIGPQLQLFRRDTPM